MKQFNSWVGVLASAAFFLSGCNAVGLGGTSENASTSPPVVGGAPGGTITPVPTPTPTSSPGPVKSPSPAQVGETCTGSGDANKICLALHFVTYQDSGGTAAASQTQAATIVHTLNQLWSQCDIGFQIEKYEAVDPTQYGLVYGAQSQNQLDQIRQVFDTESTELLAVTTGPWGTAVNAWTNLPGDGIYGAIMEASIVNYGGGIIYAHELGHYLGLLHVSDTSNLMDAIIYTTSTALTSSQCASAKATARDYWLAMFRG